MSEHHMLVLGRLARPHSIRGDIRVTYYAESPHLLDKPLYLRAGREDPRPVRITFWKMWKDQPIIHLEGVDDRTAAELLRGQDLLIAESDLPPADPNEPYLVDIIGLPVQLTQDNTPVGILEDVLFPAGQEVWSIRTAQGQEILLPAVPEFVDDIDLDEGLIRISPPPGLLDIYLSPSS